MKIVKNIVIGLAVFIAVLALVGFVLPREYKVERSTSIQAPAEVVFEQVNDLKKNEAWTPWKDPEMTVAYSPNSAGVGATSTWQRKKMGNGSQTIEESNPPTSIKTNLDFGPQGTAKVQWSSAQDGEATKVTQAMTGDQGNNPFKRWVGLGMNALLGKYFDQGLASLKQVSETRAAALKVEQAATQQAALAVPAGEGAAPEAAAPAPAKAP
jgi:ribosome-associated toxin RatA of RatAB toxin-antitoxin module